MSSKYIYTPDPTDPFVIGLQEMPMLEVPSDAKQSHKHNYEGEYNNFYGKTHSEETKRLYSETRKGKGNVMYGRSAITEQQLRWYTDGTKNIYVTENTQHYGFRRGRSGIKRRTQSAILEARKSLSNS